MKIMKDYHDLHLKVNALLLIHVLETFRQFVTYLLPAIGGMQ